MNDKANFKHNYVVVEFLKEKGIIDVIPENWIKDGDDPKAATCYWPPFRKSLLSKAIHSQISPEITWPVHEIKIIYKSSSFEKANKKATYYEKYSDIDLYSSDERQKSRRKLKFSPLSDNSDEETPQKRKWISSVPSPPAFPSRKQSMLRPTQSTSYSSNCNCSVELRGLMEKVLSEVESLKKDIKELSQQKLLEAEIEDVDFFPVKTIDDLIKLNESLNDNEEFSKLVHFLGRIGGKDLSEVTRRILGTIMTNSVALQLNWVGGFGKHSMKDLSQVILLISAAVRQVPTTKGATQAGVEDVVKRWLRTAIDRDGGRVNRKQKSASQATKC